MLRFALSLFIFLLALAAPLRAQPDMVAPLENTAESATDTPTDEEAAPDKKVGTAKAPAEDLYTVKDIKVDEKAENAMKARDKAFTVGQREAFTEMCRRLVNDEKFNPANITDPTIARLIQSFEIENEQSSGVRYIATLTFHFKPGPFADLFEKNNIVYGDHPLKTQGVKTAATSRILVLPLVRTPVRPILWEEKTPWHMAWESVLSSASAAGFVLPEGNLQDVNTIAANEVLAAQPAPLTRIMNQYQAQGLVVAALISPTSNPASFEDLSVQLARFDATGKLLGTSVLPLKADADKPSAQWLQNGAAASMNLLRDIGRPAEGTAEGTTEGTPVSVSAQMPGAIPSAANTPPTTPSPTQATRMTFTVPINSMAEWSTMRESLRQIAGITQLETLRMNRTRVVIQLGFEGGREQLARALGEKNLQMVAQKDGTFLLQPAPPDIAGGEPSAMSPNPTSSPVFQTVYPPSAPPQDSAGVPAPPEATN
jgi:hypothetical protein